jgi:hypothetical protein
MNGTKFYKTEIMNEKLALYTGTTKQDITLTSNNMRKYIRQALVNFSTVVH